MRVRISQRESKFKTSVQARERDNMIETTGASSGSLECINSRKKKDSRLNRVMSSGKMKRTPIYSVDPGVYEHPRKPPVIIHSVPAPVIQADPSEFLWIVQLLTGSPPTRSRCKKNRPQKSVVGAIVSTAHQQSDTSDAPLHIDDASKFAEESVSDYIACKDSESPSFRGCSDDEDSVSTEFFNQSINSVSTRLTSSAQTTESGISEITDADSSSMRGPIPLSDWIPSDFLPEDRFFASLAPSPFDSYCPSLLELAEHFADPAFEPIPDSIVLPVLPFGDVDSSIFLNDIPTLSSLAEDEFIP